MGKIIKQNNKKKLTAKESKFLEEYFKSGNGTNAAMKIYNVKNKNSAGAISSQVLKRTRPLMKPFLESKNISLGRLVGVLNEGLSASKVVSAIRTDSVAGSGTSDFIEVPDYKVRHEYLKTAAKWLGINKDAKSVNIQINQYSDIVDEQKSKYGI